MNSLNYPPEEPPRPRPEDMFRREPRALDTYKVPDYATGALPLSPFASAGLAIAVIGLALSLFPWVGLFLGVPAGAAGAILAAVAAWRIHRGLERGAAWTASGMVIGAAAVAVGVTLTLVEGPVGA
jgi:hypothetical protein